MLHTLKSLGHCSNDHTKAQFIFCEHRSTKDCDEENKMEALQHHGNNIQHIENEVAVDLLVDEIVNVPDGYTCFLCQVTSNTECVWNDIREEIVAVGDQTEANIGHDKTLNERHRAARFACYRHYIYTISNWTRGAGRIRIPSCIERQIKLTFPGNGEFVGFRVHQN